jgi:DNA-directed RNA polymerase specialized sigma24 family protein
MELRMSWHKQEQSFGRAEQHAWPADFCRVFHQDMDVLYWLALTLTSDEGKAEECFVAGLEECIEGNSVFKEWARSWSRRVVIKNAIRLMSPRPEVTFPSPVIPQQEKARQEGEVTEVTLVALVQLTAFDRFVYVMTVLEGYTDRDCATLLGCSTADLVEGRLRALHQIRQAIQHASTRLQDQEGESQEPLVLNDVEVA